MDKQAMEKAMAVFKKLEGCIHGGHGADAAGMCIDMMQTELDALLEQYPDADTAEFDAIIERAIQAHEKL